MRDLYHNLTVTQILKPATISATNSSATLDVQGYHSAAVVFAVGTAGDTLSGTVYWTLKIRESDDDSAYNDVAEADLQHTGNTVVVDAMTKDETAYVFGYRGTKRYLKAVATPTGTHSVGTPMAVFGLLGHPANAPVK